MLLLGAQAQRGGSVEIEGAEHLVQLAPDAGPVVAAAVVGGATIVGVVVEVGPG